MKFYNLEIIHHNKNSLHINVLEPETLDETIKIQQTNLPKGIDGIINFPLPGEVCVQASMFQYAIRQEFDWVSINWQGKILNIDKNVKSNQQINFHPDSISFLILQPYKKYILSIGDTVIHEKFCFDE